MPNGSSEGVKVKRWKPVFHSGRRALRVNRYTPSLTIRCHLATLTRREGGTVSGCRTPNWRDGNNPSPFKSRTHRNILSAFGQVRTKSGFGLGTACPLMTQCMVRPCVASGFCRAGGERSCINVSGLSLERVVLRAIMDISARAISLAERPRAGHLGHQCSHAPGRPNLHLVSSSRRPRQVGVIGLHHLALLIFRCSFRVGQSNRLGSSV